MGLLLIKLAVGRHATSIAGTCQYATMASWLLVRWCLNSLPERWISVWEQVERQPGTLPINEVPYSPVQADVVKWQTRQP